MQMKINVMDAIPPVYMSISDDLYSWALERAKKTGKTQQQIMDDLKVTTTHGVRTYVLPYFDIEVINIISLYAPKFTVVWAPNDKMIQPLHKPTELAVQPLVYPFPEQLSRKQLEAIFTNPRTAKESVAEMHAYIGWLLDAYEVIKDTLD